MHVVDHRVQVVVPKGAPPKSPDQKEGELRQEAKWVCCVKWLEVRKEKYGGLPVVCHDGCWNDTIVNVLGGDWKSDSAPVECTVPKSPDCVFGNGDVENVIGDCGGCPVGSAMPQVIGVDVRVVGESGQNGSWDGNVVDRIVV